MIPGLGAEGAAKLQKEMTEHVVNAVRSFRALSDIDVQGTQNLNVHLWLTRASSFQRCRQRSHELVAW